MIIFLANTATQTHWQFDERILSYLAILLFYFAAAFALMGSIALNLRLLRNWVLKIDFPTKSLLQLAILTMSAAVLGGVAGQDIRVFVHFDAHLVDFF